MSYSGAEQPNHTQTPNSFFDELLPEIESLSELKVTLAIIRQTFGWHKEEDELSITRLMILTGLSRQGVITGVELGMARGSILRRPEGQSYLYRIKLVNNVDLSTSRTGQQRRPEVVNNVDQLPVNDLDPQKKEEKETKKKKELNYIADATAPPPKASKSQKLSTADPRSRLPPIQLVRTIIGHYPKLLLYDKIIETLGESPDGKKAVACATECAARGWNVENLNTWLFNWYINGIPEKQGNGNGKHQGTNHKTSNIDRIQRNLARCGVEIAPRRSGSNSGSLP